MKVNLMSLGLFFFSALLPLAPAITSQASAACVMVDVNTQLAIRGSHDPASQNNNVEMDNDENCFGNATVDTGTQFYSGSGEIEQNRNSSHYVGGGTENSHGLSGSVMEFRVDQQSDIYSPAHDPNIINSHEKIVDSVQTGDNFSD